MKWGQGFVFLRSRFSAQEISRARPQEQTRGSRGNCVVNWKGRGVHPCSKLTGSRSYFGVMNWRVVFFLIEKES